MKGLKVKKISIILFLNLYAFSTHAVHRVSYCFNNPIKMKCVDQENGNFSLEGQFKFEGKKYDIGTRRAYEASWCFPALNKIISIMTAKTFCLEAEVIEKTSTYLTIENFSSEKGKWSYFSQ